MIKLINILQEIQIQPTISIGKRFKISLFGLEYTAEIIDMKNDRVQVKIELDNYGNKIYNNYSKDQFIKFIKNHKI